MEISSAMQLCMTTLHVLCIFTNCANKSAVNGLISSEAHSISTPLTCLCKWHHVHYMTFLKRHDMGDFVVALRRQPIWVNSTIPEMAAWWVDYYSGQMSHVKVVQLRIGTTHPLTKHVERVQWNHFQLHLRSVFLNVQYNGEGKGGVGVWAATSLT